MLKRIYVDNYKCLVNTTLSVKEISLFLGANGSGKSAVFEVLRGLQNFVCGGERILDVFPSANLTRWQTSPVQTFEIDIEGNEGIYKYELAVEHDESRNKAKVDYECLFFDEKPLIRLDSGDVHLYRDDFSEGPSYPVDWTLSAVGSVPPRPDNTRLMWFRECLGRFIIVQVIPPMMREESSQQAPLPSPHLENYISWYRYISQDQGLALELTTELKNVLPGFDHFKFLPFGEKHRLLKAIFQGDGDKSQISYNFSELSDGQQMLIALYSLLCAARAEREPGYTLCIDEPGSFVALSEIQPWLTALYDNCLDQRMQALLISHHPELINYLLASPIGYWFERQSNCPTRVRPITAPEGDGLSISELIARGWLGIRK